jgi:hypothetical protein
MGMVAAPRRATYGASLFIAFGWHLAVITALLALVFVLAAAGVCIDGRPECLGPAAALSAFVSAFAAPVGLGLLIGTPLATAALVRGAPTAASAGGMSALAGQIVAIALIVLWVVLGVG